MGFLAPALLGLGVALAVPLALHLLHRQQGPRVPFPALRYLRRAERERAVQIRLRQILLLGLRLLILTLIVLAAARPFVRSGTAMHAPTATVVVLDNSMSTGLVVDDARVLDRLKERALETFAAAGPADRLWLLNAASPEPAATGLPRDLADRVRATRVSAGAADLTAAVRRAADLLQAGAEERGMEIHLLTDLQAASFPAPVEVPPGIVLAAWAPSIPEPANRGVTAVLVGGGLPPRVGERSTVSATVSGAEGDSVELRLILGGRVRVAALARAGATTVLPLPAQQAGVVHGHVEIDADALRGDDRRYFTATVLPPPAVAVTGPAPFLEEALAVLVDGGRLARSSAGQADIVFAPGGRDIPLRGPVVVVLPPAEPLGLPALNQRLVAAGIPWEYGPDPAAGQSRLDVAGLPSELAATLVDTRLHRTYRLSSRSAVPTDTLLVLRDGTPWLIRGRLPGGIRYLLLGSPLHPRGTTIPVSAAMLPFLDHLAGVWAGVEDPSAAVEPGDEVRLPGRARSVQRPDGRRLAVEGGAPFRAPATAGVYTVWAADTLLTAFSVNPPARESDLRRAGPGILAGARLARRPEAWTEAIFSRRRGASFGGPLLVAALGLLLLESLVSASGGARVRSRFHPAARDG